MTYSIVDPYLRQAIGNFVDERNGKILSDSVRAKKTPEADGQAYQNPTNIYMLYVGQKGSGLDVRRLYDFGIDPSKIDEVEAKLFKDALGPTPAPTYIGRGFDGMHWRFPCYFTIVIDLESYKVNWGTVSAPEDPILFRDFKKDESGPFAANHSFYNAIPRTFSYTDGSVTKTRDGIRCINYLTNRKGNVLDTMRKKNHFAFDICLIETVLGESPIEWLLDPDGQNQGPPSVP